MKATCPNDPSHKRFVTTAHVMQSWFVHPDGTFDEVLDESMETVHGPDPSNIWTCAECDAIASVES